MTGKPHSNFCSIFSVVPYLLLSLLFISATAGGDDQRAEDELFAELKADWNTIFPSENRNAGGAMFFKHILDNYENQDEFMTLNQFYCPVSGSIVDPLSEPEFVFAEDAVTGKPVCGSLYRCCWPCSCDIMRLAQIRNITLTFENAAVTLYAFVMDNPCGKPDFPQEVSRDDFCVGEDINQDRVHVVEDQIVIGILHDGFQCTLEQVAWIGLHRITGGMCAPRNATPIDQLKGGMGDIFAELAD